MSDKATEIPPTSAVAHVVMVGATVRAAFTGDDSIGAAARFCGQLGASSADDDQDFARLHGAWIAAVELNPPT